MPDGLSFLVLALAAWRAAYLLAKERAPFDLMAKLRKRTTLGGLLTCIYCASFWTALLMLLLWYNQVGQIVVWVFGLSGAALMLWRYTGGEHGG